MTTTLRGVFPEPKPVPKKNYIKENVKHIKRMQGLLQDQPQGQRRVMKEKSFEALPVGERSHHSVSAMQLKGNLMKRTVPTGSCLSAKMTAPKFKKTKALKSNKINNPPAGDSERVVLPRSPKRAAAVERIANVGVQTEATSKVEKLYETGVIVYPSPNVLKMLHTRQAHSNRKSSVSKEKEIRHPSSISDELVTQVQNISMTEKVEKKQPPNQDPGADPYKPPTSYQKGVLPKYLRQRKEEQQSKESIGDFECPPGHVLLPEEERKETLRVLRESYAERIQELNSMPVRNDTLKMKKRKMAIEEELKKIDEGIKVFQRPKVFVKVNA